ncbi:uncharacterized protein si:ch73-204p21.2 [Anabas testudineus]|uniref:uncharacterized protein si:ch73-204p21.2 n=1 Tax=Anabas testudineus TaxID=64144 RepID=UPI000E45B30A|nr:uncharacterized protein si:ch73-204p21.2 [Anabas testudineus]
MAAVGAEVTSSWFLSSGVVSFFILLLLLSIFLTSLCSDCGRRSFELQDSKVEKNPSALIKVVKLEEAMMARENPMIDEIQKDEKGERRAAHFTRKRKTMKIHCEDENHVQVTTWKSHLGAPQNNQELNTEEGNSVQFPPWRSHLTGAHSPDVNSSTAPDSDHIYHTIGGGETGGGDADTSPPATNHEPRSVTVASVYAQVSKKVTQTTPTTTVNTPEQVQEEEEEEESSPPLPGRTTEMEG